MALKQQIEKKELEQRRLADKLSQIEKDLLFLTRQRHSCDHKFSLTHARELCEGKLCEKCGIGEVYAISRQLALVVT